MNLAIIHNKVFANRLCDYITEVFKINVEIEETQTNGYLLTVENASDYIVGFVDGIVKQYQLPIKEE